MDILVNQFSKLNPFFSNFIKEVNARVQIPNEIVNIKNLKKKKSSANKLVFFFKKSYGCHLFARSHQGIGLHQFITTNHEDNTIPAVDYFVNNSRNPLGAPQLTY